MNPMDLLALPASADLAYGWINVLIPQNGSAYGSAFATFSGTLAFFGALFLSWNVTVGVISSAYSGKVLGDRYHQIYAPLRVVLGFAMLVPISSDGFSAVHYLLRNVIGVAAVQLGNAPIKSYVTELRGGAPIGIRSALGAEVAKDILDKELCMRVYNGLHEHRWVNLKSKINMKVFTPSGAGSSHYTPMGSGIVPIKVHKWDYGSCGSYGLFMGTQNDTASRKQFYKERLKATQQMQQNISGILDDLNIEKYFGKHGVPDENSSLIDELQSQGVVAASLVPIAKSIMSWNTAVGDAAGSVYSKENQRGLDILEYNIHKYGFMAAGGFERQLSQVSKLTFELANQPIISVGSSVDNDVARVVKVAKGLFQKASIGDSSGNSVPNSASSVTGEFSSTNDLVADFASYFVVPEAVKSNDGMVTDPIGALIQRGHSMIAGATILAGLLAVANGFANSLDNDVLGAVTFTATDGLSGALQYAIGWLTWAIGLMFILGILHAYVLPMIPFFMVFIMGISWLIMFLEAAIAAVLWSFAFIKMDGQDFFDKNQSPGVALLFNLLLRPAIGMLAFIGGLILLPTVLRGLMFVWDGAWSSQQSFDWTQQPARALLAPFTMLASWFLFWFMQWHLTLRIFGLVPTIADRVGHWMGFGQGQGYNDGGETQAAVTGAVGGAMAARAAPIMGGGGGRPRPPSPPRPSRDATDGGGDPPKK
ncbi:DotA/TraY family protein [Roseibium sp. RKSG952]|uniref:DotA/TraY family protein n=1 Tax=Roseibium sp. RKSG952 TaxID=2529384 RepID=UPI0012BB4DC9|nr:DotA/TraY family protein [Roseibium sp. RKSG952]MTH95297.1 hypothetical protein [Roseibium sp. RKSG952]